jgi:hypothetical protein
MFNGATSDVGPAVTDQSALLHVELWWVPVSWVFYDLALVLELSARICCVGLVGLHHLFYKGVAGPLGLQASSPVCRLPYSRHP